jgi:hypothetical protein
MIHWTPDDGGRAAAGFRTSAGDCVTRAVAIATGLPYTLVYDRLADGNARQRRSKHDASRACGVRTAAHGIAVRRPWFRAYMHEIGFTWHPCFEVGTNALVHLSAPELPPGRLVVVLQGHYAAVIDHVLHDTWDCSHDGTRRVFAYWQYNHPDGVFPEGESQPAFR